MSIYLLKPRFQALLRPLVNALFRRDVTANQVTLGACAFSVALGVALYSLPLHRAWFAAIPLWMLLRMGFNAIDGMLAREHGLASRLGAYLNELTDVVSDAALYLPFAAVAPFEPLWIGAIVLLAALGEMAGVLGQALGGLRRYDGPMGKSDRAFVFGLLGATVALLPTPPAWLGWSLPLVAALTAATVVNRVRSGLSDTSIPSTTRREAPHDAAHLQ